MLRILFTFSFIAICKIAIKLIAFHVTSIKIFFLKKRIYHSWSSSEVTGCKGVDKRVR